ncbi:Hyaluronan synthase-like protein [Hapsidospora chrysogenum ATCC 11550]|uniref:Hyaluronan synthase-like protein n=1 Tax=Hapsidospora chrysogenum (strain ATCC 11550 / CBS 779.69 / DSM 880 / IAM 14645 / JCM 23072 / IMI 49137) TaxID=857340 RepID=A0A086T399_HAPC1|nr:Hyaluronan synthase-like protein [Hapsidospora chrysogenum ATCC 11550]
MEGALSAVIGKIADFFTILLPSFELSPSPAFWVCIFWALWIHRYLRLIVHCVSHWVYKSKPIPEKPSFTSKDVTVVIPTIHTVFEELRPSLESILACRPAELILVTTHDKRQGLDALAKSLSLPCVRVLDTPIANKRIQVCEALPRVKTAITIMADDDVTWPSTLMPWILAPFEDPKIGGVGTCQRVRRERTGHWTARMWNWLGAAYIERRNFEISATHNIDGGTSCMSGRTGAYRSEILSSHDFLHGFKNERWRKWILNADDDNFVTRWLVSHQWKTWIQYEPECEIETTLENSHKFLYQCSRWARSNWRSNWTSLVRERYVLKQQPWSTYALHIATFTSLAFLFDPLLLVTCWWATSGWAPVNRQYAFWAQFLFMFGFTKVVKLVGLFRRHPSDVMFLPVSICFGYFHGLIKLYALATLNMTSWGSRADGDTNDEQRLCPAPQPSIILKTPPGNSSLIRYNVRQNGRLAQVREAHSCLSTHEKRAYATYDSGTSYDPLRVHRQV